MTDYRVNLDIYNGPLDLLLFLIRREEVDIYDIPIASITEQYIKYTEILQQVDPNLAGDFLVMAATLLEIKTRILLPAAAQEESSPDGLGIDPRTELVRQLLQYKAFKDAAGDLRQAAVLQSMRFARRGDLETDGPRELDLEDVQVWDLVNAFGKLMEAIGHRPTHHEVIYDDTPLELHMADILDRLQREGALTFEKVFEGRTNRGEIVGLFLALLELVRQEKILAGQERNFGEIYIQINSSPRVRGLTVQLDHQAADAPSEAPPTDAPSPPQDAPAATSSEPPSTETTPPAATTDGPPSAAAGKDLGRYVADAPADDSQSENGYYDSGTKDSGTGV